MDTEKKILEKKVDSLMKDLCSIKKTMESMGIIKNVIKKEIKSFGNSSHIILPKEYLNKKARVIIT